MDILDYTSYQAIRLTVGLSTDELPDTLLADEIFASTLSLAFAYTTLPSVLGTGTFVSVYATISAISEGSRTALQQKFCDLVKVFSAYVVAEEVCNSLSTKIPKVKADGKASLTRFSSEATFKDTVARVREIKASLKYSLENINSTASFVPTLCGIITPEVNVVTGE